MEIVKGGFVFTPADETVLNQQRNITQQINNNHIQVGATFLNMSSKNPYKSDWFNNKFRDTNLQEWIDNPELRILNLGFNLQFGWVDIDIDAEDPQYNRCLVQAFKFLGVDSRFAFGRTSKRSPSHIMVQLNEEESNNFEYLRKFEPKEFKIKENRFKTELRSYATSIDKKNESREAKQTVMPGSIYKHRTDNGKYDISVWYNQDGDIAKHISEVAATTPRKTEFRTVIAGITFGTFLYFVAPQWTEGSRQAMASKIAGWLARVVLESQAMNGNEHIAGDVYCPIEDLGVAEKLLEFICEQLGDKESKMRIRTLHDAAKKLERNPDAKIPGWPTMEQLFGGEAVNALRTVFMPGTDVSLLTKFAERYLYDDSDDCYIDRHRFFAGLNFGHPSDTLQRRHINDFINVGAKPRPAFKLFEVSSVRRRVSNRDLYPEYPPGAILRITPSQQIVGEDDEGEYVTTAFNTWRGWPVALPQVVDQQLLNICVAKMDRMFELITQKNEKQTLWLKKWLAWIIQHPGEKQQIAPVIVGGQGVGKSFFGNIFLEAIFGNLWGSASPRVLEGSFSVEPFINKMVVFIDEAKFNASSTEEIKKIIRSVTIGGSEKYKSSRTYKIYARVVFASNRFDMNIGQQNVNDRALYYIKAQTKESMGLPEAKFKEWAITLKPFFDEFATLLRSESTREHLMHYFATFGTDRHDIETTEHSSGSDEDIVVANMSWPRIIAKYIAENGRIWDDLDITAPFTIAEFNKRVLECSNELGMRNVNPARVMNEFKEADIVESYMEDGKVLQRFRYKMGTICERYSESIGVKLEPRFVFTPDDFGDNNATLKTSPPWRGTASRIWSKF